MGTIFTVTIETRQGRDWGCEASFRLGKAYEFAMGVEWVHPILLHPSRIPMDAASRLGFVFSGCPSCSVDGALGALDGRAGAYVCRTCGEKCERPARFNEKGERFVLVDAKQLKEDPIPAWRIGHADRASNEYYLLRGVAPPPPVLAAKLSDEEREGMRSIVGFRLLESALEVADEIDRQDRGSIRIVLWADQ